MTRIDVIRYFLQKRAQPTYLEIGLALGDCWLRIHGAKKIGVDPRDVFTSLRLPWHRRQLFKLDRAKGSQVFSVMSDEFFAQHADEVFNDQKIDVAFIDGWHSYEQSLKDTQNCLQYLKSDGVIILHDCNPPSAAATAPTPQEALRLSNNQSGWNGDVWKTIVHLRSTRADLNIHVLDCDEGLGIIQKGTNARPLSFSLEEISTMSFIDLDKQRESLLNLVPAHSLTAAESVLRPFTAVKPSP